MTVIIFTTTTHTSLQVEFYHSDIFRRCPQWSKDEGICARNVNNEVQFYEGNNFGMFDQSPIITAEQPKFFCCGTKLL